MMKKKNTISRELKPFKDPKAFYFRIGKMHKDSFYPGHSHQGGEFVYSYSGIMELDIEGGSLVSTPSYGIWLPPNQKHTVRTRGQLEHGSFYIPLKYCYKLPSSTCSFLLSPLIREILFYLKDRGVSTHGEEEQRLLHVLYDQIQLVKPSGSYLPRSNDTLLIKIMELLESKLNDTRSLSEIAKSLQLSERTIARHFRSNLGITFIEWRQRLKVVQAISMIRKGQTIESVSKELGYSSPSAFIVMFRKLTGSTPSEYQL